MYKESNTISRSFSSIDHNQQWGYSSGVVATPKCMVRVYSQGGTNPHSFADFVYDGKHFRRTWRKEKTDRGLAVLANRFVREILGVANDK